MKAFTTFRFSLLLAQSVIQNVYPVNHPCGLSAKISCRVNHDGRPCSNIMIQPGQCEGVGVTFEFTYCNRHRWNDIHALYGEVGVNHGSLFLEDIDEEILTVNSCKVISRIVTTMSCAHALQAKITVKGELQDGSVCENEAYYKDVRRAFPSIE